MLRLRPFPPFDRGREGREGTLPLIEGSNRIDQREPYQRDAIEGREGTQSLWSIKESPIKGTQSNWVFLNTGDKPVSLIRAADSLRLFHSCRWIGSLSQASFPTHGSCDSLKFLQVPLYVCVSFETGLFWDMCGMGWLRVIGLKLQVSFAREPYKRDDVLQKRPIVLRSLLIVATSYLNAWLKSCNFVRRISSRFLL